MCRKEGQDDCEKEASDRHRWGPQFRKKKKQKVGVYERASNIHTAAVDGLKALDPKRPIREADIGFVRRICLLLRDSCGAQSPQCTAVHEPQPGVYGIITTSGLQLSLHGAQRTKRQQRVLVIIHLDDAIPLQGGMISSVACVIRGRVSWKTVRFVFRPKSALPVS